MRLKMLLAWPVVVALCGLALPTAATSGGKDEKGPAKTPTEYVKTEIRGKLTVAENRSRNPYDDTFVTDAVVVSEGTPLALRIGGEALRKKLAALDGKMVVVTGSLRFVAPPADAKAHFGRGLVAVMVAPPPWPYVEVSGIDAANAK
jgi:hypothetical protein